MLQFHLTWNGFSFTETSPISHLIFPGGYLLRNIDDANEVVIFLEMDDLEKARQLVQSEDLRQAMERSGVADQPDIYFLDLDDRPSA